MGLTSHSESIPIDWEQVEGPFFILNLQGIGIILSGPDLLRRLWLFSVEYHRLQRKGTWDTQSVAVMAGGLRKEAKQDRHGLLTPFISAHGASVSTDRCQLVSQNDTKDVQGT